MTNIIAGLKKLIWLSDKMASYEEDFYLTLLSNSSFDVHPDNKTSSFTACLPKHISLTGSWSVSLAEIHYPMTFDNVLQGDNYFIVELECSAEANASKKTNIVVRYNIPSGYYPNITELLRVLNNAIYGKTGVSNLFHINQMTGFIEFEPETMISFRNITRQVFLKNEFKHCNIVKMHFGPVLSLQLGFEPGVNIFNARGPPSVSLGIPPEMLIYCSLIEPQLVGDVHCQVIKIVPTLKPQYRFGEISSKSFSIRNYVPVAQKHFKEVEINIRSSTGKLMPFNWGTSYLLLHFKKNKNEST